MMAWPAAASALSALILLQLLCVPDGVKALSSCRFTPLATGQVQPSAWMNTTLQLQLDELSSSMPLFYAPINRSRWLVVNGAASVDGTCVTASHGRPKHCGLDDHGGLHETFVYWLNGVAPLASILRAERPGFHSKIRHIVLNLLGKYCGPPSTSTSTSTSTTAARWPV